jgi:hypothetical protein
MTPSTEPRELTQIDGHANELLIQPAGALAVAGHVANEQAARGVFADYLSRKADNTIRRQHPNSDTQHRSILIVHSA